MQPWGHATVHQVLEYAALSANLKNNDAIDQAITQAVGNRNRIAGHTVERVVPFNSVDKKTTAVFATPDGHRLHATKGAPQVSPCLLSDCSDNAAKGEWSCLLRSRSRSRELQAIEGAPQACIFLWQCQTDPSRTCLHTGVTGLLVALHGDNNVLAMQVVAALLDDEGAKAAVGAYMEGSAARGLRALGVATSADEGTSWQLLGLISLLDPPREDTLETIRQANDLGIEVRRPW